MNYENFAHDMMGDITEKLSQLYGPVESTMTSISKEANNMMIIKLIAKIPLLPVLLIIRIAGVLLYGIAWILAHLTGPVLTLFVVCGVYAVYTQNWAAVAVFAISSVLLFLFFLALVW